MDKYYRLFSFSNLTLLVALALSTVAAYYSIIGLTAIFAGAVIPVIIMGSILEVGKITTTVWLRKYWKRCGWLLKVYLVPAVVALAVLTSMGIFGFLSKAHTETGLVSGDVQAKLSLYDEKIKTQRDNIEVARKALQQMDAQVDARLARGESESGAERAVQIRRQQQGERSKLQKEIGDAQKEIAKLNEERAPIAAENRKVEAEVGPIKYVAALIYGDNPDSNLLERAVRWVIILLVIVFDPLAIALVLAANSSKEWDKLDEDDKAAISISPEPQKEIYEPIETPWPTEWQEVPVEPESSTQNKEEEYKNIDFKKDHPYLYKTPESRTPPDIEAVGPLVYSEKNKPEIRLQPNIEKKIETLRKIKSTKKIPKKVEEESIQEDPKLETKVESLNLQNKEEITTEGITKLAPFEDIDGTYVMTADGKHMRKDALKEMQPELFILTADHMQKSSTNFGTSFPKVANKGDIFVRVDVLPNRVYKFDNTKWVELNKQVNKSYLNEDAYLEHLIHLIDQGQCDIEDCTEAEKAAIEDYLVKNKK